MSRQPARPSTASPIRLVRLSGPSDLPDPRQHAFRTDLADVALAGRVVASHYAEPVLERCVVHQAAMRARPDAEATAISELLFGESFAIVERRAGWCWGYGCHDRYVGYIPASALGEAPAPTHRITAPTALVFAKPDIKSPLRATLHLGAEITAAEADDRFLALDGGGFVHKRHTGPLIPEPADPIALAHQFRGTPYLWGGRTRAGIDCSGLIQTVLTACGYPCPRDSDQQRDTLGTPTDPADLRTGDLVFFPGHVGIMASSTVLLHANAYWMNTVVEQLADVVGRLQSTHEKPITAVRRLA